MKHLRYSISSIAALSVLFILASCGMPTSIRIVPTNHMARLRAIVTDLPARHKVGEVVNIDQIFEITVNKVTTSPRAVAKSSPPETNWQDEPEPCQSDNQSASEREEG